MRTIKYFLESIALVFIIITFKVMPPPMASNIGGYIGRRIGPRTGAAKTARANIKIAFPDKSEAEREAILIAMWDNLGRVIGEYPHLRCLTDKYCEIENIEILQDLAENNKPCLFIGMHQANWEVAALSLRSHHGLNVGAVYRAPNNPWAESILQRLRDYKTGEKHFAKSTQGVREMIKHLKDNGQIGLLIDQKYNEGIQASFFNQPAMTSTAYIELARKFDCPIIPVQMERINGCYFRMHIHPALELDLTNAERAIAQTHDVIEGWIKDRPAEWLWVHKRWVQSNKAK